MKLNLKKTKVRKKRKQSLSTLKKKAWKFASLVVRRRDANQDGMSICYTCGLISHWSNLQAGHAIGGRHNAVLLDFSILRPQCLTCNFHKRGNYQVFITKLIVENGFEWWQKKLEDSRQVVKRTAADYEEFIEECKSRLSVIERAQKWNVPHGTSEVA